MTNAIARVDFSHVSKRFRRGTRADSLRDLLPALGRRLFKGDAAEREASDFWALRDVSFSVEPGHVLGIIGPNGAGKSTVLRLLTGLLTPDQGRVEVHGRIGALIELAAGFHPDLTGRENVFLQGALLGLSRAEVRQRFEAIVDFAEIESFIDTPVKRYSSGMNARLGFAIAVHAEPDVLLVDEVLAVGDRAFQAKAFIRLEEELKRGIPVVMVSHQLERIAALCNRAILLSRGSVAFEGPAQECVSEYMAGAHVPIETEFGVCPVSIDAVRIVGSGPTVVSPGDRVTVRIEGTIVSSVTAEFKVGVRLCALPGDVRIGAVNATAGALRLPAAGSFSVELSIALNVGAGVYMLQGAVWHEPTALEWATGPSQLIKVRKVQGAGGTVFLAPDFESRSP